jgi:hypothetical protein
VLSRQEWESQAQVHAIFAILRSSVLCGTMLFFVLCVLLLLRSVSSDAVRAVVDLHYWARPVRVQLAVVKHS